MRAVGRALATAKGRTADAAEAAWAVRLLFSPPPPPCLYMTPLRPAGLALAFVVLALLAVPAASADPVTPPLDRARALIADDRPEDALTLLRPLLQKGHSAPEILFEAGRAALAAAGRADLSVAARAALLDEAALLLSAVLAQRPGDAGARMALARTLFLKGEDDLSRRQFERLLSAGPPAALADDIRAYLRELPGPKRWSGHVGTALSLERGAGLMLWGGLAREQPLSERLGLRLGIDAGRSERAGRKDDRDWLGLHLGPVWRPGPDTELVLLGEAERLWAGGKPVLDTLGLRFEADHDLNRRLSLRAGLGWHYERWRLDMPRAAPAGFPGPDDGSPEWLDEFDRWLDDLLDGEDGKPVSFDGPTSSLSLGLVWQAAPNLLLRADIGHERERPKARAWRNGALWGRVGASLFLPRDIVLDASARLRRTRYDAGAGEDRAQETRDGRRRRDRTVTLNVSLLSPSLTIAGFTPQIALTREVTVTNAVTPIDPRTRLDLRFLREF